MSNQIPLTHSSSWFERETNDLKNSISNDRCQILSRLRFSKEFEMKDSKEVKYFLGIHIERDINNKIMYNKYIYWKY